MLSSYVIPSLFKWSTAKPPTKQLNLIYTTPSAAAISSAAASDVEGTDEGPQLSTVNTQHGGRSGLCHRAQSTEKKLTTVNIEQLERELAESVCVSRFRLEQYSTSLNMIKLCMEFPTRHTLLLLSQCIDHDYQ